MQPGSSQRVKLGRFEMHDRSRFECTAFSFGTRSQDVMRQRLVAACEHFIDVRDKSDYEVALLSRERQSQLNRVVAFEPAESGVGEKA
jgi:predicted O-linked N-acetylglucosamine transferase (SPINDLY family)